MEDMIALIVVVTFIGAIITMAVWFYKLHKRKCAEEAALMEERKRQVEEYWEQKRKNYVNKPIAPKKIETSVPPRGKEMTKTYQPSTPMYVPSATQSVQNDDGFLTGMLVGAVIDNVMHSSSHKSSEDSSSSTPSTFSWGLDDSDSRSSISSSMSDSWSSSSSDSGPSSDW